MILRLGVLRQGVLRATGVGNGSAPSNRALRYLYTAAPGTVLTPLSTAFGTGVVYTVVGTMPGQLALSGSNIVAGATAATLNAVYTVKVRATSSDTLREVAETLTFTAGGGATPVKVFDFSNSI